MLEEAWTQLVDESGGTWPPSPSRQFPSPLDKLHELALEAPNVFSRPDYASMNHDDIKANRAWLVERLQPTDEVLTALRSLNQHQILGMAACMSTLAHMYRWGSVPTLTAAQEEKRNHLPNMILAAQMYLNGRLGIRSTGGTITTLSLCNYDRERDVIYYSMTKNFTPDIIAAELWNAKLFHEMERIAEPFYRSVVQLADDVIGRGKDSTALEEGNEAIRQAFAYFYKYLKEPTVSKAVWSRYAQGFHGWSWDGFEGVSGDQAVMVRVMDALLGIPPTSPPTHLTKGQRDFVDTLRAANIRQRAIAEGFPLATKGINDTLRMLKTWRMGHVKKACFYEDIHLPERKPMSGGKGTDADLGLEGMVARIQMRLQTRTALTR